ncbi:MAG TPA: SGNH/GDSL hydrolase family protein [Candidatus Dormibacteraeota bacterium]|nr:SGNH/GDSL hydrolase family protein [Candidatus Dormibacteraeota bacterium]
MSRLRAAAAVLVLGALAAWGAQGARPPAASRPAPVSRGAAGGPGFVRVPVAGAPPVAGMPWFLTIGDSITFGYTRDPQLAGTNISWAGVLERRLAAGGRRWRLFDIACPGESTVSYPQRCPGRRQMPLLAGRSQRAVALDAIAAHGADLRLIVVALGANDLLQALRADATITQVDLIAHLEAILTDLRAAAPGVPIVVAGMYNPFALASPRTEADLAPIDAAIAALGARLGDPYADFHAAINQPSDGAPLCSLVDCADLDIHPTTLGQQRLAQSVLGVIPGP